MRTSPFAILSSLTMLLGASFFGLSPAFGGDDAASKLPAPSVDIRSGERVPDIVRIGFLPVSGPEVSREAAKKICAGLSKELGVRIEPVMTLTYSELLADMNQEKVDFAFLSPVQFVEAEKTGQVKVLLKKVWKEPYYYATILALKSSKIKNLKDLKGHRIAFVDQKSSSGYLYPHVQLLKSGFKDSDFQEIVFSGSHSRSVSLLEQKKVDAIAVFSDDPDAHYTAWNKFKTTDFPVQKIWMSEPIPNEPFCVRSKFYENHPKLTHSLMFAMIDVVDSLKNDPEVTMVMGANGFMPATSRQYDSVREIVKFLGPIAE